VGDHLVLGILIWIGSGIAALIVLSVVTLRRADLKRHDESLRVQRMLADFQRTVRQELTIIRQHLNTAAGLHERQAEALAERQERQAEALAERQERQAEALARRLEEQAAALADRQERQAHALAGRQAHQAELLGQHMKEFTDDAVTALRDHPLPALAQLAATQEQQLASMAGELTRLAEVLASDAAGHAKDLRNELLESLKLTLDEFRAAHAAQLEQVRAAVDEKLETTVEQRLGESFRLVSERLHVVSDRLDHVHRGLGEVQAFAAGLGHLQRAVATVRLGGNKTDKGSEAAAPARSQRRKPVVAVADAAETPQASA
jgi:DNA recombination protein RmuC